MPSAPRRALILWSLALSACGGGDGGTTSPPVPAGFTVSLSSTTLSIEQGASGSITATIGRTGNLTATIDLAVENMPAGITASFNPSAITSSTTSTTMNVAVAASVAPGPYSFTIRGTAPSADTRTATVSLTVTARPAIAMALSAASASVQQGANASYTATVSRTNFTGAVSVAVTGAPAGVSTSVTNAGDVYTVTVTVGGTVVPNAYTLTTTASATGVTAVSGTLTLTVTAATPRIALAATPAAVTVAAGGTGQASTIAITRINFTGAVVLAVQSGLPNGATATINPAGPTIATSATVTFTALVTTVPGTYQVVLQGAGFPAAAGLVTIALTVTAPPTSIGLSAAPGALSLMQGTGGTTTISIARTNFAGSVAFAASGQPNGVTPTFTPAQTTGNAVTLGLAVAASVTTGTYQITVTASGTGISNATVVVPLTVTQASAGGNVVYTFCAASGIPIWFAAQSGTGGAWVAVPAGAGNTFSTTIAGGVGAVAWVKQVGSSNSYALSVNYGTVGDLIAGGTSQCLSPTLKTVTGTVTGFGVTNSDFVSVALGWAFASPSPTAALPNFSIVGAPDGVRDLVGTRSTFNLAMPQNPLTLNKIFLRRGLNPANLSSVGTVDFNGSDAFDPDTKQVTISGAAGHEFVSVSNTFITNTLSYGSMGSSVLSSGSTVNVFTVPSAKTMPGDVQAIAANAIVTSGTATSEIRSVTAAFRDPANQTVTLGAPLNPPTVSAVATSPYVRMRTQLGRQNDYQNYFTTTYNQFSTLVQRSAAITMTQGYIGAAATFDVTIPDFTGVGGWLNTWGLQTGANTAWNVSAFGWVSGTGGLEDGSIFRIGQRQGTIGALLSK